MRCLRSLAPFGTPDASSVSRRLGAASTSEPCLPNHASASSKQPLKATASVCSPSVCPPQRSAASHRISQPQRTGRLSPDRRCKRQRTINDTAPTPTTLSTRLAHNARSTTRPALHRPIMAPAPYETAYLRIASVLVSPATHVLRRAAHCDTAE